MGTADSVVDHNGVRIGSVDTSGAVVDHNGVRIGSVDSRGDVHDHNGVRIGRRALSGRATGRGDRASPGAIGTSRVLTNDPGPVRISPARS